MRRKSYMENGVFTAGVLPGAPQNDFEIKFLICYLLYKAEEPVAFDQLCEIFQTTGYVNYFEFTSLISEMIEQGHIKCIEETGQVYCLTEHGKQTAENFYKAIPISVRERCEKELKRRLKLKKRLQENNVHIVQTRDGYTISIEIEDIGTPLMQLSIFMPTREDCERIKRRFLNDPSFFYQGIMSVVTGDIKTFGMVPPSGENLFE